MKQLTGIVTSVKMSKTVVVEVERLVKHHLYGKIMRKTKKFKVHNDLEGLKEGDRVKIASTRPLSKEKHFKVTGKI